MAEVETARASDDRTATVPSPPATPCQVCGAPHRPEDPVLCARCGEPVLAWGWA